MMDASSEINPFMGSVDPDYSIDQDVLNMYVLGRVINVCGGTYK